MSSKKIYDIIIAGGGPAGLGTAINCAAKGLSVLLLEKNKIGNTKKTWLTFNTIIKKYGLERCIRNEFSNVKMSSYLGSSFSFKSTNFIYPLHEEKALQLLAKAATSQGAVLQEQESFITYVTDTDSERVIVKTTKNQYKCSYLIDARGRESKTLLGSDKRNKFTDMGCISYFLENIKNNNDNEMILYDSFFPGSDYFWFVPLEKGRAMVGIFFFASLTAENRKEKSAKLELYMQANDFKGKKYDTRYGNIPLGGQTVISKGKVLTIGDSANTPLPSSGFSFNRCLEESEVLANFLVDLLKKKVTIEDYKKKVLAHKFPAIEAHLLISDMLTKFSDAMLNKGIGQLNKVNEDFIISFLSGSDMGIGFTLTAIKAILNTFSLTELSSLSLHQDYLKILSDMYNMLPALTSVKISEQVKDFFNTVLKKKYSK